MAMNFDVQINQLRSVLRGEVGGSVRFMAVSLLALAAWLGAAWMSGMARSSASALNRQEKDLRELSQLADTYKASTPLGGLLQGTEVNAMATFTTVSGQLSLADRVGRILPSSDGKSLTVEINRIYAEELVDMLRELNLRGIRVREAAIRALPAGQERLFSVNATLEPRT